MKMVNEYNKLGSIVENLHDVMEFYKQMYESAFDIGDATLLEYADDMIEETENMLADYELKLIALGNRITLDLE